MKPHPRRRMSPFYSDSFCVFSQLLRSFPVCYSWCCHPERHSGQLSRKSFLNLLCLHHLLASFVSKFSKNPAQSNRHLSVWDSKHVYLQIIRELGKKPQRKLSVFRPRALVPWCNVRGCTLDGVDSHSQSLKEQCGGWRCVTAHRVLICSEEGGSNPDLFHPAAQRQGFF